MGFRNWLRRSAGKKPRPPWVRPEFLGLTLVVAALLGLAFTASAPNANPGPAVAAQQRSEYVGLEPGSLPAVDCAPTCQADDLLNAWKAAHPAASILEVHPRYHEGALIGYLVVYEE